MANLIPISTYNLALQPFSPVPAIDDDYPISIRITLAAVDPEAVDDKAEPSTLRLLKRTNPFIDEDLLDSDEEAEEDDDEEDELDDKEEEVPEPKPETRKSKRNAKKSKAEEAEVVEISDEGDVEGSDEGSDDDLEDDDVSEFIVCTLSPKSQFQQTIDLTICPDEDVYFVVTGSYPVHLVGNYIEHPADDDSSDDEDYDQYYEDDDEDDLTPDEDEIINQYDIEDLEDESDIEGKIQELVEEEAEEAPSKNKKKRAIEAEPVKESKKSKKDKKKDKQVQFTEELEQGPSGSTLVEKKDDKKSKKEKKDTKKEEKTEEPKDKKFPTKTLLGGVITEDRKAGKGPAAKSGNKVGIRYIGKLKNGKVFDKNTSGKPFVFGLGKGECIKGFDLGVAGMAVGGERRVIIPAKMGYGSQALPGIPANSELTFDIKLVSLK